MTKLNNITVQDFKSIFGRDFPYLPKFDEGKSYFLDDSVYYNDRFYISLKDLNEDLPMKSESWGIVKDCVDNYVQDSDIERAFIEAKINFNPSLWKNEETLKLVFCYLAAHYLVTDLYNAENSLSMNNIGFVQSKSVGSVSESYGIPTWMLNNPIYSGYVETGYGRKYLNLIMPYLIGNIILTTGKTTLG